MTSLADRAAEIGRQAKAYADARGTTKPEESAAEQPPTEGVIQHDWWRVYWPLGFGVWPIYIDVMARPAQTRESIRALYPGSDAVPIET